MRKVLPLDGFVLVKPVVPKKSKSGIVVPGDSIELEGVVEVIEVSENIGSENTPGVIRTPAVSPGDIVYLAGFVGKGKDFLINGEKHYFIPYSSIMGVERD